MSLSLVHTNQSKRRVSSAILFPQFLPLKNITSHTAETGLGEPEGHCLEHRLQQVNGSVLEASLLPLPSCHLIWCNGASCSCMTNMFFVFVFFSMSQKKNESQWISCMILNSCSDAQICLSIWSSYYCRKYCETCLHLQNMFVNTWQFWVYINLFWKI